MNLKKTKLKEMVRKAIKEEMNNQLSETSPEVSEETREIIEKLESAEDAIRDLDPTKLSAMRKLDIQAALNGVVVSFRRLKNARYEEQ